MKKLKKWWLSIVCWVLMLAVWTSLFISLHLEDDFIILGACVSAFVSLSILFMLLGMFSAPESESKKYKMYEDFLKWYEQKKKEIEESEKNKNE